MVLTKSFGTSNIAMIVSVPSQDAKQQQHQRWIEEDDEENERAVLDIATASAPSSVFDGGRKRCITEVDGAGDITERRTTERRTKVTKRTYVYGTFHINGIS
ncbi:hypothetical protein EYR40_002173 [Pleurotus pulmonarius]|nr:hypothetical protein EYR40_002173 [Pleurotus pulmonarius]